MTQLTTTLVIPVRLPSAKRFLTLVGSFSAVGAILGTALGFRMGMHLFDEAGRDSARYALSELLGTLSDGIMLMTLIMIALCWPYTVRLAVELVRVSRESERGAAFVTGYIILIGGNLIGINAAGFGYQLLTR